MSKTRSNDSGSPIPRAALYLRLASVDPADSGAIAHQRQVCLRIAARCELDVIREYVDLGKPGLYTRQTALKQLLTDLGDDRDMAFVIVSDYTRLSRRVSEFVSTIRRIRSYGAEVISAEDVEMEDA